MKQRSMSNITEKMENIDKMLRELGLEEIKFGEKTEEFKRGKYKPTIYFSFEEKEEWTEAEIKRAMRFIKRNSEFMVLGHQIGYFVNEEELDETDEDLIDEIKQM